MGAFLTAAYRVLNEIRCPMTPAEIVCVALRKGYLATKGKTPHQTMKAKLSTDILQNKESSDFMRAAAGRFALRKWRNEIPEHVAPRFKKSLFDEDILVFPASELHRFISQPGISTTRDTAPALLAACTSMRRREAEEDTEVIQLVSFYLVRYRDKYLTYKRTKRLPESRLHGFYSIGFGGHLNPDDVPVLFLKDAFDYALETILRELREELITESKPTYSFRGLLYDDSRPVSRQHLGLVYDVELQSPHYTIGERGFLIDPRFETLEEILAREADFENWSVLIAREEARRCHDRKD